MGQTGDIDAILEQVRLRRRTVMDALLEASRLLWR